MARYIRPRIPGARVFLTIRLAQRGSDLLAREMEALREAARQTLEERPVGVNAWVVLPDHMHCIWTLPDGDHDFSRRVGAIKGRFSARLLREGRAPGPPAGSAGGESPALPRRRESGIWQRRFWEHHIRDAADMERHLRYCWSDPVAHGLVTRAADWPFTTLQRDIRAGRIPYDWSGLRPGGRFGE